MKTFIFRKPKSKRSDKAMKAYMEFAGMLGNKLSETESVEEGYYYLTTICECFDKAAKAGGFLKTEDFLKWVDSQNKL